MQHDLSAELEAVLTQPTVLLPAIHPPDGWGRANHPPANGGPRADRRSKRTAAVSAKIPAPVIPLSPAPAGAGESAMDGAAVRRDSGWCGGPLGGPGTAATDRPAQAPAAPAPAPHRPARDQSAPGRPAKDQPARGRPAKDQPAKPDNAGPAGGADRPERRRNLAVDRLWSDRRNRSMAARPATRPFVRVRGRHAAMSRRQRWERRYVRSLVLCDLFAGTVAGAATFGLRFGDEVTSYNRSYMVLSALLPVLLLIVLAVSRAYERRFLFVGTDEYQRVFRGGVGLIAGEAVVSYALDLDLARGYVLAALPTAVASCVVLRFVLRHRLHAARVRGESLRRVILVGHELAIIGMTRQLRRECYHGLEVVGGCLPLGPYGGGCDHLRAAVR